jgi:dTDP-4-amino-4,6-dideoxygalactose transaminase
VRCLGPDGSNRLPVTEGLATSLLGLPFHSRLSAGDVATVVEALATAIGTAGTS